MFNDAWFDEPRYHVWQITSSSQTPADMVFNGDHWVPTSRKPGTSALVTDYLESANGMAALVNEFNVHYGVDEPTVEAHFGSVIREFPGARRRCTRLVWTRETSWGGRISDAFLVTEISEH